MRLLVCAAAFAILLEQRGPQVHCRKCWNTGVFPSCNTQNVLGVGDLLWLEA